MGNFSLECTWHIDSCQRDAVYLPVVAFTYLSGLSGETKPTRTPPGVLSRAAKISPRSIALSPPKTLGLDEWCPFVPPRLPYLFDALFVARPYSAIEPGRSVPAGICRIALPFSISCFSL